MSEKTTTSHALNWEEKRKKIEEEEGYVWKENEFGCLRCDYPIVWEQRERERLELARQGKSTEGMNWKEKTGEIEVTPEKGDEFGYLNPDEWSDEDEVFEEKSFKENVAKLQEHKRKYGMEFNADNPAEKEIVDWLMKVQRQFVKGTMEKEMLDELDALGMSNFEMVTELTLSDTSPADKPK